MMTYYTTILIGVVLMIVVDGSSIISSIGQPTPFKYTFRVEKLEFGNGLEGCTECEGDGAVVIGNKDEPDDSLVPGSSDGSDRGAEVCEYLKIACNSAVYPEDIKDNPEAIRMYSVICNNYEYVCGDSAPEELPDYPFIPEYPDTDQGEKVCQELEKACANGDYPDEIEDNPAAKKMFSLICKNYEYVCGESEPEEPDDYFIHDYSESDQGARVCQELEETCFTEEYPDAIKDDPEAIRFFSLICKNYDHICSEDDEDDNNGEDSVEDDNNGEDADEDIYSEVYEEVFDLDEDDYYEDEDEEKRKRAAYGIPRTLKRRNAFAHNSVTPKLKRSFSNLHLLTKRERAG